MPQIEIHVNGTQVQNNAVIPVGGHNRRSLTFAETHGDIVIVASDQNQGGTFNSVTASLDSSPPVISRLQPVVPTQYDYTQTTTTDFSVQYCITGNSYKIKELGNTDWNVFANTVGQTYAVGSTVTASNVTAVATSSGKVEGAKGVLFRPDLVVPRSGYRIMSLGNTDWNAVAGTTGVTYEAYEMSVNAGFFRTGALYKITSLGTSTNWNSVGYSGTPALNGTFTATGPGSGDGVASLVDNKETSYFTGGDNVPPAGTTGVVMAMSKFQVMEEVTLTTKATSEVGLVFTPSTDRVTISGKHVGGFLDEVTYVPKDSSDILSPPPDWPKTVIGIGAPNSDFDMEANNTAGNNTGSPTGNVPPEQNILLLKPDTTIATFKFNVSISYTPNLSDAGIHIVTGSFSWTFYHKVYPWFDGCRDFMDAYYAGGNSHPKGNPNP